MKRLVFNAPLLYGFPWIHRSSKWTIASFILGYIAWLWYGWNYIEDDAFIHLEFARNIAVTGEILFKGIHVNGDSSPLWIILLAGLLKAGLSYVFAAKVLSILGIIAAFSGILFLVRQHLDSMGLTNLFLLSLFTSPYMLNWSYAGMEAGLALGLTAWMLYHAQRLEKFRTSAWIAVFLTGLLPLLRFELLVLSACMVAYILWSRPREAQKWPMLLLCALPFCAWSAYSLSEFGSVVPTTNAAKSYYTNHTYFAAWWRQVMVISFGFGSEIGVLLLAITCISVKSLWFDNERLKNKIQSHPISDYFGRLRSYPILFMLLIYPIACMLFYTLDRVAVQTRYVLVFIPFFMLGLAICLKYLNSLGWVSASLRAGVAVNFILFIMMVQPHVSNKAQLVENMLTLIDRARLIVAPDAPIAIYSIGQVGLYLPNPIIDTGGILMPEAIPYLLDQNKMLEWARAKGARCLYLGSHIELRQEFVKVASVVIPAHGWLFPKSKYDSYGVDNLWCERGALLQPLDES